MGPILIGQFRQYSIRQIFLNAKSPNIFPQDLRYTVYCNQGSDQSTSGSCGSPGSNKPYRVDLASTHVKSNSALEVFSVRRLDLIFKYFS